MRLINLLAFEATSPSKSAAKVNASDSMDESDTDSTSTHRRIPPAIQVRRPSLLSPLGRQHHYGSFYLRMGAVGEYSARTASIH